MIVVPSVLNTIRRALFLVSQGLKTVIYVMELDGFVLLTKRNCKKLDFWYLLTVALFPFLFAFLIIHGYDISAFYVVTGIIIYNGVWYGTLGAMVINEDRHNNFLTHMKFGPQARRKQATYALSIIFIVFILSIGTAVGLILYFHIHISWFRVALASLIAGLISLGVGTYLSTKIHNTTVFNNSLNIIFLVFTYQTVIPVKLPILLYTNPLYYVSLLIR